jgi:hypothetical protein
MLNAKLVGICCLLFLSASSITALADDAIALNPEILTDAQKPKQLPVVSVGDCQQPGCAQSDCSQPNGCEANCCLTDGLFFGIGGSYNSVRLGQTFTGTANSNVFIGNTLVASGIAGGPTPTFQSTLQTFAPLVQVNYLQNIADTDWAWGTKFAYKYLGLSFTDPNVGSTQAGTFTSFGTPDTFTGHLVANSELISIDHELGFLGYLAHSFDRGRIYFGGGPVVFATQTHIYDVTGYADINGTHSDVTGTPITLGNSLWMWGGTLQLGMMYYVRPLCYIDISYDVTITGRYTQSFSTPFSSESGGFTTSGIANISTAQSLTAQSLNLSLNRAF